MLMEGGKGMLGFSGNGDMDFTAYCDLDPDKTVYRLMTLDEDGREGWEIERFVVYTDGVHVPESDYPAWARTLKDIRETKLHP